MGDPASLVDFVTWTYDHYPADKYALIVWDHGWREGVCVDITDSFDYLTPNEIHTAMQTVLGLTGKRIDLIGFDACLMSVIEVAYITSEAAKVIVASEEVVPFWGWPYNDILSELVAHPNMSETTLAEKIVHYYMLFMELRGENSATLSAFNLTKIANNVVPAVSLLADHLNDSVPTRCYDILNGIALTACSFYDLGARDIYHFAQNLKKYISDLEVEEAAQNVMDSIVDAQVVEWHGTEHPNFHGLCVYLPPTVDDYVGYSYNNNNLVWVANTFWDDFIHTLFATYAPGLESLESFSDISYSLYDSDADDYLDAVQVRLNVDTTADTINVSVYGNFIDPLNNTVDFDVESGAITSSGGDWIDLYLSMPVSGDEGWYDVELFLYDYYGVFEDYLYSDNAAYLPEEMLHDAAVNDISTAKTVVGYGFQVKINITVEDKGHYQEIINITTYANKTVIDTTQLIISSNTSINFLINWNTSSFEKGFYTISTTIEPLPDEINLLNNNATVDIEILVTIPGDVDGNKNVDIFDVVRINSIYGVEIPNASYDPICDINDNGDIDIFDVVIVVNHYGESW